MFLWSLKRSLSTKTFWAFKQTEPLLQLTPSTSQIFGNFQAKLEERLKSQYLALCNALCNNNLNSLRDILEPGLKQYMESEIYRLKSSGYRFKRASTEDPHMELSDLQIFLGVNINRSKNLPESEYLYIGSVENIKDTLPINLVEEAESGGGDAWDCKLNAMWMYINLSCPANIVITTYAKFTGNNPITLCKENQEDSADNLQCRESHVIQFELEPFRIGSQGDAILSGELEGMIGAVKTITEESVDREWTITDIDHAMNGNPFVAHKLLNNKLEG